MQENLEWNSGLSALAGYKKNVKTLIETVKSFVTTDEWTLLGKNLRPTMKSTEQAARNKFLHDWVKNLLFFPLVNRTLSNLSGICTEIELRCHDSGYFSFEEIKAKTEFGEMLQTFEEIIPNFENEFKQNLRVRTWARAILLTTRFIPKLQPGRVPKPDCSI